MSTIFVLLLVFFLHNGNIMTQGISAHSLEDCQEALPLILEMTRKEAVKLGSKYNQLDDLQGKCVEFRKATI